MVSAQASFVMSISQESGSIKLEKKKAEEELSNMHKLDDKAFYET